MTDRAEDRLRALWAEARNLRTRQKHYFRSRTKEALLDAKRAEAEIDRLIDAINAEFKFDPTTLPEEGLKL